MAISDFSEGRVSLDNDTAQQAIVSIRRRQGRTARAREHCAERKYWIITRPSQKIGRLLSREGKVLSEDAIFIFPEPRRAKEPCSHDLTGLRVSIIAQRVL